MIPAALHFVVELRVDEFEYFLEDIDARVCEYLVLHFLDQTLERFFLGNEFVLLYEVLDRPTLGEDVLQLLMGARDVRDVLEVVRVFAVVVGDLLSVRPDAHGRARGVAVGFELLFALGEFRLFDFDDDVLCVRLCLLKQDDVGAFDLAPKMDGMLQPHILRCVAVSADEHIDAELAHRLLRGEFDALAANEAVNIGGVRALGLLHRDACIECSDCLRVKECRAVCAGLKEFVDDAHVCLLLSVLIC